jgi:ABC-type sugar transport system substrate-binding protein
MMRKVELLAALLAVAAVPALAAAGDPPSRVARLSYQSGTVSFRPGTVEEWTAASLNYPLTTGDHLWADAGAQVEMDRCARGPHPVLGRSGSL